MAEAEIGAALPERIRALDSRGAGGVLAVAAILRALLGCDGNGRLALSEPSGERGVLHTTSVWRDRSSALRVLRIGDATPRSECDRFLLGAARARAAVLLTSGSILRAEPDLRHELHPRPSTAASLAGWRSSLGEAAPPALAVLSRGDVPFEHAALHAARDVVVLTEPAAVPRVVEEAERHGLAGTLRVAGLAPAGARGAVAWLRERYHRVTVELGPSAARELYAAPVAVDELWLARWMERAAPAMVIGRTLLAEDELGRALPSCGTPADVLETSGRWRFERRLAAPGRS